MYEYDHNGNKVLFEPPHPGGAIEMELEERGMTVEQLAEASGVEAAKLQALIDGKADFTKAESVPLQHHFGYDRDVFMSLQELYAEHTMLFRKRMAWEREHGATAHTRSKLPRVAATL